MLKIKYLLFLVFIVFAIDCEYCGVVIDQSYIQYNNKNYHSECYEKNIILKCSYCKKSIENKYLTFLDKNYHEKCYNNYIVDKCSVCNNPLKEKYYIDLWNNKYHVYHNSNCDSCGRIISNNTSDGGVYIGDNRMICGVCDRSVVKTKKQIEDISQYVYKLLQNNGINNIPKDLLIKIVNKKKLCDLSNDICGNHRGLTLYEYDYDPYTGLIKEDSKKNKIYILNHLHETEFASVLAHEYLHVWLNIHDLKYNKKRTEGFCQLASDLVYQSIDDSFSKVKLKGMEKNNDINYGYGYRKMKNCLEKHGWLVLVEKMLNKDKLICFYK